MNREYYYPGEVLMMEEKTTCSLCGQLTMDGLKIHGEMICPSCEGRITELRSEDEDYHDWLAHLRSLWSRWVRPS
ncbi:MAG: hypothetical protein GX050_00780 [Firmicutes bacterium]|nr:hypothetical protein [Bacillota bacterium]